MRRFLRFLALAALFVVPLATTAQALNEGFEDAAFPPDGWTKIHVSGTNEWSRSTGTGSNGSTAFAYRKDVSGGYNDYLITPQLAPAAGDSLSFWIASQYWSYAGTTLTIEVSTTTPDAASFTTTLATYTSGNSTVSSSWSNLKVDLSAYAGQQIYIAFHAVDGAYDADVKIDNVSGTSIVLPACSKPTLLTASAVDANSITLEWTDELNTGATYSIRYCKNGSTDTTIVTAATTSHTFTGLDANSLYYFEVKAVCSATEESAPISGSFRTACAGSTCDITLQLGSTDSYSNPFTVTYYTPASVELFQGGGSLGAYSSNTSVEVCGTDPIVVKYNRTDYTWGDYYENCASIVVKDGGGVTVYSGSWGDTLCTITTPCPSCIPPTDLTVFPDSNQIEFSWTPRSGAGQFIVYLNDSVVNENVTDTFYTFTDLPANTAYTVKVQSVCTGNDSSSIASKSTHTACGQISLPYFVDFNDAEYNGAWYPCWDSVIHAGTDPSVNNTARRGDSGYGMYFQGSSSENYNLVVSPRVPTAGNNIYVRFWGYLTNANGWLKAGVMTNPYDTSTFIPIVNVVGNSWNEYEFNTATLDANATYYVAWMACIPGASYNTQIGRVDDVLIDEIPACTRVTSMALDSADADALHISWADDVNTSASYTVYYWKDGSTDTLNATSATTSLTLSALDANTVYKMQVVANCGSDDAEASPVFSFRTACGAITLPFFDNFDSYANGAWPPCWHRLMAYGTDPSVNAQFYHSGSQAMFLLSQNNDTNLFCTPSPVPTTGDNIYVRYWAYMNYYSSGTKWIKAGVMTDTSDVSTFIALDSVGNHNFNDVFEEREFNTATLDANATYWVAWMYVTNFSSSYDYSGYSRGAVDDVYISEIPSCLRVSDLTVTATDSSNVTLSWNDSINSGATYTVMVGDSVAATGVTETSYTVQDLEANTQYTFKVSVECGSETSEAQTVTARTTCAGYGLPYTEGFETNDNMSCWTILNPASSTGRSSNQSYAGSYSFLFFYTTNPPEYLISPMLSGTDGGVRVRFQYRKYSNSYSETFQVGYTTTASTNVDDFTWGDVISDASYDNWTTFEAIYPTGTKYVAIKYTANNAYGLYIDDIEFMLPPDCMPAYDLVVDTVTAAGATIHWSGVEGQNNYFVRLNDSIDYEVSDSSYTFTGLDARTAYTVAVAADCAGDTSEWISTSFITGCAGDECEIVVASTSDYASYGAYYTDYAPKLSVMQNGVEIAVVQNTTNTVSVCAGMPVAIICRNSTDSWAYPSATVINGGEEELFNGSTSSYGNGDTLVSVANACPSCLKPSGVMATQIDSNMITFVWNLESGVDYIVSLDDEPYIADNSGTYNAYGLNPNTVHTFAVKAVCQVGDTSNPRIVTVRTACGEMAIPYTEGFEGNTVGEVPPCWSAVTSDNIVIDWDNNTTFFPSVSSSAHSGTRALTLAGSTMVASSAIPLPGDSIKVSFWAASDVTLEAGVMTNPLFDSTFTPMLTIAADEDYALYEFNTSTLSGDSTYYLAFRINGASSPYYDVEYANIDDINITRDEGCMTPTNVTLDADTVLATLYVSWTNTGAVNNFVTEYRTGGGAWSNPHAVSTTADTLTGLNYATTYQVRVGLVCGNDTLWTVPVSMQTVCGAVTVPYYEEFVSADGTLPACWDFTSPNVWKWNRWTDHAETSGDGEMMSGTGATAQVYAILPRFAAPFSKLQITFKAKLGNISEGDSVIIGVYDETFGTVTEAGRIANPSQSRENFVVFTYNFLNYTGNGDRIALSHSHNPSASGEWGMAVDSIVVIALPDCYPPTHITAHNTRYPNSATDVQIKWQPQGMAAQWQVYMDTITSTVDIDAVPESQLITVNDTVYQPAYGLLAEGAKYRFFVRSYCDATMHSDWVELQGGVATDEVWMNNSNVADTVIGCDFIIYDNGGPVAGYLHNSNSALVIRSGEPGREVQIQRAWFSHGGDANTFTVYDGEGTNGTVLYTNTNTNMEETLTTVLATSTTGSLTLTFTSGYYAALGYELSVHCVGQASCAKPTNLIPTITAAGEATVTWNGSAPDYHVYYKLGTATNWTMQAVQTNSISFTGLVEDTTYDLYVVAICSATDSSVASNQLHFSTHYTEIVEECPPVTDVNVTHVTATSARVNWVAPQGSYNWEIELSSNGTVINTFPTTQNPRGINGLSDSTQYKVRVRTVCDEETEFYSEWSDYVVFTTRHVGIGEVSGSVDFVLYPNPASTIVTIDLSGFEGTAEVNIIDQSGRTAYSGKAQGSRMAVDVAGYARGAYFVRVTGSNASAIRKLVVK